MSLYKVSKQSAVITITLGAITLGLSACGGFAPQTSLTQDGDGTFHFMSVSGGGGIPAEDAVLYEDKLNISFGQIGSALKKNIDSAINSLVRRENCGAVDSATQYTCGEMPIGTIVDGTKKVLMNINVAATSGRDGDVKYNMGGATLPVYLERTQTIGQTNIAFLDARAKTNVTTSAKLGDDVFVQLDPKNGTLAKSICIATPGLRVYGTPITLRGTVVKSVPILPDIKGSVKATVDIGYMRMASALICADLETKMDAQGLPVITLKKINPPEHFTVVDSGLKVTADADVDGFYSFINSFLKWFGTDIERTMAEEVQKEVRKVAGRELSIEMNEITSGAWFRKYLDQAHLEKLVEKISTKARAEMEKAKLGRESVQNMIAASCLAAVAQMNETPQNSYLFMQLCRLAPKVEIKYFNDNANLRGQGCYSNYFNPRFAGTSSPRWWENECEIENKITVTVAQRVQPLYGCLMRSWNTQQNPKVACAREIFQVLSAIQSGQLDDLLGQMKRQTPYQPALAEVASLRSLVSSRLAVELAPASDLEEIFVEE